MKTAAPAKCQTQQGCLTQGQISHTTGDVMTRVVTIRITGRFPSGLDQASFHLQLPNVESNRIY